MYAIVADIAGITSLHLNGAALAGCGRARLEDNWATLDRWPFSDDQFDTFPRVAVKQNMSSCSGRTTSSRLQMSGMCPLCEQSLG